MDRNILDDLMNLLNEPGPVNWALAEQVAGHLTGPRMPVDPWLAEEYVELARLARYRVVEDGGLSPWPEQEIVPIDPAGWVAMHVRSFRYLVEPLAELWELASAPAGLEAMLRPLRPALLGMQMGTMVGILGRQAFGQFDIGLPTADPGPLGLVVSHIEDFAGENHLDPRQVRLWVVFQETTRDALLARDWVRPHFWRLVEDMQAEIDLDAGILGISPEELSDPAKLGEVLGGGGEFSGALPAPAEGPAMDAVRAFISILEGYTDFLLSRLGESVLPDLGSIQEAMRYRQTESQMEEAAAGQAAMLPDLESAAGQYGEGARFCSEVAERWGEQTPLKIWDRPDNLPTYDELADATGWAARVLLDDQFTGEAGSLSLD